ncbi:hypothetical protein [Allorhodopirellula solitaria]|nr:hypothetical protein [Allorhodopirellula solitaria]
MGHHSSGHHSPATCRDCQPHLAPAVPAVSPAGPVTMESRTPVQYESSGPPAPADLPTANEIEDRQPGETFDALEDPFEDDSARYQASGKPSIQQATFANEVTAPTRGPVKTAAEQKSDYADYFRQ